jgi:hypothetical protein
MDKKTVFLKTTKGENVVKDNDGSLSGDLKRALFLVDETSTFDEISRRSAPSLRSVLPKVFEELIAQGYIRDKAKPFSETQIAVPKKDKQGEDGELDFTAQSGTPVQKNATNVIENHVEVEERARADVEAAKIKAQAEAAFRAEQESIVRAQAEAKAKIETEVRLKAEQAATQAKLQLEVAEKAKAEAESARIKAEQAAERLRAEQELARAKAEANARELAQEQARQEAEAARLKAEAAVRMQIEQQFLKSKAETEARALEEERVRKEVADAARLAAVHEAARIQAEKQLARERAEAEAKVFADERARQEAARIKSELEAAKAKVDAEAKALAEERAKQEAARIKIEQDTARLKAELEVSKAKAAAEAKALEEERTRQEAARLKVLKAAAKAKAEAEARVLAEERAKQEAARLKVAQETARLKAEIEASKAKAEADARALAAEQALLEAARQKAEQDAIREKVAAEAKALAEEHARQEAARLKAAQDAAKLKADFEAAKLKAEKEEKALEAERIRQKAERLKAEQDAIRAKAEAQARALEEERASQEATRLKSEQDAIRIKAEMEAAQANAEAKAKELAELRAKQGLDASKLKAELDVALMNEAALSFTTEQQKTVVKEAEFDRKMQEVRLEAERIQLENKIAEQEAALQKEQADSKKLADEQAKAWASAEHRANELARGEASRTAQTSHAKSELHHTARKPRKALPVGKILASLFVLAVLSIWILPYVLNLNDYIVPIESKLTDQFKQPVHIGVVHAETFPFPKIQFEKLTIGSAEGIKVGNVSLLFNPFSLFSPVRKIQNVELQNVTLDGPSIEKELIWLQEIGANPEYQVSRLTVKNIKLSGTDISVPLFNGEVTIEAQGRVSKVTLRSVDDKFVFSLQPGQNHWQFSLNAKGAALPIIPNIIFDDFTANGELAAGTANIPEIDAQAFGGFLHGNAKLSWQKYWLLQGKIGAKSIELVKLFPKFGITGELQGDSNFTTSGTKLSLMSDVQQMEGSFVVSKGVVNNMDMIETVRQGNRQTGRTHFDEITGSFQSNSHGQHFQQLQITSGILSGGGSFDVASSSQVSGRFSVTLKAREGASTLLLSGTLSDPILIPGR